MQEGLTQTPMHPLMRLARLAGRVVLENGGEIYRVEDTVRHLLSLDKTAQADVLALPTGVFISCQFAQDVQTTVVRVNRRDMNLTRLEAANRISRQCTKGELTVDEAIAAFQQLLERDTASPLKNLAASALSAASFSVLFGGNVAAFFAALVDGMCVQWLATKLRGQDYFAFVASLLSGVLAALIAMVAALISPGLPVEAVIAGSIFPMLPGLSMTNAIRDTMRGDLVSGIARLAEALLIALSIAGGIFLVLKLWSLGGA